MNDHNSCHECSHNHSGGGGSFASGVIMGTVIGALMAYIMATPEGKEKARQILIESEKALRELEKHAPTVAQRAKEATGMIAEKAEHAMEKEKKSKNKENITSKLNKRFFKKKGKSLSSLW